MIKEFEYVCPITRAVSSVDTESDSVKMFNTDRGSIVSVKCTCGSWHEILVFVSKEAAENTEDVVGGLVKVASIESLIAFASVLIHFIQMNVDPLLNQAFFEKNIPSFDAFYELKKSFNKGEADGKAEEKD